MPRSGSGWTRSDSNGVFTQRAYCPTCTQLVLEVPEAADRFAFPGLYEYIMEFQDMFCSDLCRKLFVEKWRHTLYRICQKKEAVEIGVRFLEAYGSIPEQLGELVANLEKEKEEAPISSRSSSTIRRNRDNSESESLGETLS